MIELLERLYEIPLSGFKVFGYNNLRELKKIRSRNNPNRRLVFVLQPKSEGLASIRSLFDQLKGRPDFEEEVYGLRHTTGTLFRWTQHGDTQHVANPDPFFHVSILPGTPHFQQALAVLQARIRELDEHAI